MPIKISLPSSAEDILPILQELLRRAVDGTVVPLFVDDVNGRVLIGTTTASTSPAKVEISGGDLKINTAGYGVQLSNRSGTKFYRLVVDDDGALAVDPL